jgi:hypothetical protein
MRIVMCQVKPKGDFKKRTTKEWARIDSARVRKTTLQALHKK